MNIPFKIRYRINPTLTFIGGQSFLFNPLKLGSNSHFAFRYISHNIKFSFKIRLYPRETIFYINRNNTEILNLSVNYNIPTILKTLIHLFPSLNVVIEYFQSSGYILLLKQPLDETILSFIISTNNNIKRIRKIIQNLQRYYFGENINKYYFPSVQHIADTSPNQLKQLGLGYRAIYLHKTARILTQTNFKQELLNALQSNSKNNRTLIFKQLQELPGIGPKVADCIMTFSLGFKTTTPIDIWAYRYLTLLLELPEKRTYMYYRDKLFELFGDNTAIIGQHLFEWIRTQNRHVNKMDSMHVY